VIWAVAAQRAASTRRAVSRRSPANRQRVAVSISLRADAAERAGLNVRAAFRLPVENTLFRRAEPEPRAEPQLADSGPRAEGQRAEPPLPAAKPPTAVQQQAAPKQPGEVLRLVEPQRADPKPLVALRDLAERGVQVGL